MQPNYKQRIFIIGILSLLFIGAAWGMTYWQQQQREGKYKIIFHSAPDDATLSLDGQPIDTGEHYVKKDTRHTLVARRDGFESLTLPFTASHDDQNVVITLQPQTAAANEWVNQHPELYSTIEELAGKEAAIRGERQRKKYPIIEQLPYSNFLYTIGYSADPKDPSGNNIILDIDASPGNYTAALEQIRDLGYDPTDFKINFRNYQEVLKNE